MTVFPQQQSERKQRRAARMEPLAKLPVFWGLDGKKVLIAGASDAVAWKAELLCACGADVHVFLGGAKPAAALTDLDEDRYGIHLFENAWETADLSAFAVALADCEDSAEASLFYDAARRAGVPVNVIDKPEFCQFQFGSIVNRSPVVISISLLISSTYSSAPITLPESS